MNSNDKERYTHLTQQLGHLNFCVAAALGGTGGEKFPEALFTLAVAARNLIGSLEEWHIEDGGTADDLKRIEEMIDAAMDESPSDS